MTKDAKAPALGPLPADLQQSLAAAMVTQLGHWLRQHVGGTVIIAAEVPGVIADNGKPLVVVLANGDFARAEGMLANVDGAVRDLAQQARAAQEAQQQARAEPAN